MYHSGEFVLIDRCCVENFDSFFDVDNMVRNHQVFQDGWSDNAGCSFSESYRILFIDPFA